MTHLYYLHYEMLLRNGVIIWSKLSDDGDQAHDQNTLS